MVPSTGTSVIGFLLTITKYPSAATPLALIVVFHAKLLTIVNVVDAVGSVPYLPEIPKIFKSKGKLLLSLLLKLIVDLNDPIGALLATSTSIESCSPALTVNGVVCLVLKLAALLPEN